MYSTTKNPVRLLAADALWYLGLCFGKRGNEKWSTRCLTWSNRLYFIEMKITPGDAQVPPGDQVWH